MPRKHDESYKLLFSQPVAVEELVRDVLGEGFAADLDFETSSCLPKSGYVLVDMQRLNEQDVSAPNVVTSLASMETDPTPENLERVMRELMTRFRGSDYHELRKVLRSWLAGAAEAWQIPEAELARIQSWTEEGRMYERIREMREQVRRDGVEEGLERGRAEGRAEGRATLLGAWRPESSERR